LAIDLTWELTILETVHGFYLKLLEDFLEDEITPPAGLDAGALAAPDRPPAVLVPAMRRWLKLLDVAIAPEMLRFHLNATIDQNLAESLLRYYALKQSKDDSDRDKADFVVTFLYRHPRVPGQWQPRGVTIDGVAPVPPFEIALLEILGGAEPPDLSPDEVRALDEFEFLADEAEQIEHFDRLMDSGLMQKARRIKHAFGPAFFHPHALAVIGPFNYRFGCRFAELFAAAAAHIRSYADQIQERGGSLSSRVGGDVTVEHLTQFEEQPTFDAEYSRAQDHLYHLSHLQKAVDSRILGRPAAAAPVTATFSTPAAPVASAPQPPPANSATPAQQEEEMRLRSVEESIRGWVRAAEKRLRLVVPMKFGNFTLAPHEADAYCADFQQEKSFRGDNARALVRMVAVMARMQAEIEELKRHQKSAHLWQPHADALLLLEAAATQANHDAAAAMQLATKRGLAEKAKILAATMERLRRCVAQVHEALALAKAAP
jgi:hypothetical protein